MERLLGVFLGPEEPPVDLGTVPCRSLVPGARGSARAEEREEGTVKERVVYFLLVSRTTVNKS